RSRCRGCARRWGPGSSRAADRSAAGALPSRPPRTRASRRRAAAGCVSAPGACAAWKQTRDVRANVHNQARIVAPKIRMAPLWLPVVALVPALIAQAPPQPAPSATHLAARDFALEDCECIAFADLAQLREREIWRLLRASVLMLVLPQLEREAGFPLEHLDRMMLQVRMPADDVPETPHNVSTTCVLEGNAGLGLPDSV